MPYLEREFSPGSPRARPRGGHRPRGRGLSSQRSNRIWPRSIVLTSDGTTRSRLMPPALRSLHPALASRVARHGAERGSRRAGSSASITSTAAGAWRERPRRRGSEPARAAGVRRGGSIVLGLRRRRRAASLRRTLFGFRCLFLVRSRSIIRDGPFRPSGSDSQAGRPAGTRSGAGPPSRWRSRPSRWRCRSRSDRGVPGDRFRPLGHAGTGRSCRIFWSIAKSPGKCAIRCRSSSTARTGSCGSSGSRWPRIFGSRSLRKA